METKINIMGLNIDMIDSDTLILKVHEYLNNDCLNIIFLATTKLLAETSEDKELQHMIEEADLVLPGDETLLSLHHVDTLKVASMVVDYKCVECIFDSIASEEKTIFFVARNQGEADHFEEKYQSSYPNLIAVGSYFDDLVQNEELVVNKINSIAPDILFFTIDSILQEKWIMNNHTKLNSKLCLGLGGISAKIEIKTQRVPRFIQKIRMETFYFWFKNNKKLRKLRENRIFKKKVEHYKNKKGVS